MRVAVLVAATLLGCAHTPAPPAAVAVVMPPPELRSCPRAPGAPQLPRKPRTIESLVKWAAEVEQVRAKTETARNVCAYALKLLNEWIAAQ